MEQVLILQNLIKYYGKIQALNNVSFSVPKGSVFGILGPNGSGKTTLLGIIMDIIKPTSGNFIFFGKPMHANVRKHVGTLLETPNFYHYLSAERNLRIAAAIKGKGIEMIDDVLRRVNLYERRHSKFSTYSLGMKQRLAIASCLIGDPDILVFDEPTNGLDPEGIAEIRNLISKLSSEGKTIIMASHLLDEVEKVCTHVAIMKKGNLIATGHVDEVLVNEDIIEIGTANLQFAKIALQQLDGITGIKETDNALLISFPINTANPELINRFCFDQGIVLNHLRIRKKSLESKFLELTM